MKITLLIISMFSCLMVGVGNKAYALNRNIQQKQILLFNTASGAIATFVLFVWGGIEKISTFSLSLGIAFGVITMLQQFCMLSALQCGPMAYTILIDALSAVIPAISGILIWHEQVKVLQIIGVALMVLCFYLSIQPNTSEKRASARWLTFSFGTFLCTGAIGVLQKWHQMSAYQSELNGFLATAFSVYTVIALLVSVKWIAFSEKQRKAIKDVATLRNLLLALMVGLCCAVNNKLNLYLSGVIDSMLFFPLVNGGNIILATIMSFAVFHEKLSKRQWCGILVGMIAVLLLVA